MAKMNVALHDGKGTMHVSTIEEPVPGPRDVVVRVQASGICGSDLQINADKTDPDKLPAGHEVAGEIVDVGDGGDRGRIGQRVVIETIGRGKACDECWYCRTGQFIQCEKMAPIQGGGFAQYISRRAAGCFPIPDGLTWEEAALVEPLAVSVHGTRRGQLSGGETVAVLGAGNIGLTAVAAARALGASRQGVRYGSTRTPGRHGQTARCRRRFSSRRACSMGRPRRGVRRSRGGHDDRDGRRKEPARKAGHRGDSEAGSHCHHGRVPCPHYLRLGRTAWE